MKENEEKEDNCISINTNYKTISDEIPFKDIQKYSINTNEKEIKNKPLLNVNIEKLEEIELSSKIICPNEDCFSNCIINIDPIFFDVNYDCGKHKDKMDIIEYVINSGNNKEDKEICDKCEETYEQLKKNNGKLYKCYCQRNFCEKCKEEHLNEKKEKINDHNVIDYKIKDYICCCNNKNKKFIEFCFTCKKNLCILCNSKHADHKKVKFSNFDKIDKQILRKKLNSQKMKMDKFNEIINK